ncbi:CLUMA_CG017648, isoform A [Clunio marinus]|uniref:CLUMA_CG017648, isoform A n=1 Tax=Clunio marinus TaxID=568069 RepID=A0A1J1IWC2_9DIPT|nr:CLUMA_CG017648, isoform A [Clunio marinus]
MKIFQVNQLSLVRNRLETQLAKFSTNSSADENYQFLQKSNMPTYYFQKSLPRLPIPKIEKTLERYLAAQRPLLTDDEFKFTEDSCKKFVKSGGWELQAMLKEKDKVNSHTSYISEPWFTMYSKDRAPLPVNYNPIIIMNQDPKPEYNDQILKAANVVISSMRFMKSLKNEILVPEIFHINSKKTDTPEFRSKIMKFPTFIATYAAYFYKAYPLDMNQYKGLFGATRIPKRDNDVIYRNENTKHILVLKDGNFYTIDVLDANGNIREPEFIYSQLKYLASKDLPASSNPIAALTTQNRRIWASARNHLISLSARNSDNMTLIDSALFCISLDDTHYDSTNPVPTIRNFLFDECKNRWYDKSLSVIIDKDGTTGVNFEHSWGDGVAVLRYFNELHKDTINNPFVHPTTQTHRDGVEPTVKLLEFDFDEKAENDIKVAIEAHQNVINSIDMRYLKYENLNKSECKKFKVSPDSFMQLSFQMGYHKQNEKFVASYESCSTSAFRHGRTETIRPCTSETKQFCEAISSKNPPSNKVLRELMDKCSTKHNQLTKEAAMGQGFDRHLFALKTAAERVRIIDNFDIFKDPAYARINHNIISTSTLSSPALLAGGFGPVVKNGYGIGYSIQDKFLGCLVANYKNETDGKEFIECMRESYDQLAEVVRS